MIHKKKQMNSRIIYIWMIGSRICWYMGEKTANVWCAKDWKGKINIQAKIQAEVSWQLLHSLGLYSLLRFEFWNHSFYVLRGFFFEFSIHFIGLHNNAYSLYDTHIKPHVLYPFSSLSFLISRCFLTWCFIYHICIYQIWNEKKDNLDVERIH